MPRPAAAPVRDPRVYDSVAEVELGVAEVLARYYALSAPGSAQALEARERLSELRRRIAAREPIEVPGERVTAALAELRRESFERYGDLERRPGRWRIYGDGRYEPAGPLPPPRRVGERRWVGREELN